MDFGQVGSSRTRSPLFAHSCNSRAIRERRQTKRVTTKKRTREGVDAQQITKNATGTPATKRPRKDLSRKLRKERGQEIKKEKKGGFREDWPEKGIDRFEESHAQTNEVTLLLTLLFERSGHAQTDPRTKIAGEKKKGGRKNARRKTAVRGKEGERLV